MVRVLSNPFIKLITCTLSSIQCVCIFIIGTYTVHVIHCSDIAWQILWCATVDVHLHVANPRRSYLLSFMYTPSKHHQQLYYPIINYRTV